MKIEKVTIERKQLVFSDSEFSDINNALCWLRNAALCAPNILELQRAVDALKVILTNIKIRNAGNYYILNEEVWRDGA